ncbi:hypothetical protein BC826DRAFT_527983 [Russula brevipes]|nr:hypothetical protein BC826DRAFT_527983 [Russula brevipes]
MLDVWPALPIVVSSCRDPALVSGGSDNAVAALGHRDRVCHIDLRGIPSSLLQRVAEVMQEPLPELTYLNLQSNDGPALVLPDSFLGGSSPRLRTLWLMGIPYPALPKLLLSAGHLVWLHLSDIPHSGYISPEVMVNCLATMTRLSVFELGFTSPRSYPNQASRGLPLPTQIVLPALTHFSFRGVSEYLEDLVARIDTPLLRQAKILFFNQLLFDVSQLSRFVGGVENYKAINRAYVAFLRHSVEIILSTNGGTVDRIMLKLVISCRESDWQLSSLVQICSSSLPPLPALKRLIIYEDQATSPRWRHKPDSTQWVELLRLFTGVTDLYLSERLASIIAPTLRQLARNGASGALPRLRTLFLEEIRPWGLVEEEIEQFVAWRRLFGRVDVCKWERWL